MKAKTLESGLFIETKTLKAILPVLKLIEKVTLQALGYPTNDARKMEQFRQCLPSEL
jgi:hypothetical protein